MSKLEGLSIKEAKRRLRVYGKNEIVQKKKVSVFKLFFSQFTSPIILLLIFSAILSFFVNYYKGENYFDSLLILTIVFAAGISGFVQDYKAERTIEALKKMATPKAKVIRDGKILEILATEVVKGDLIVLEGGDVVPADAKIIEGRLEINESILTGESASVNKKVGSKIFSSTAINSGKAVAKVFAIGMGTQVGKIAGKMQKIKKDLTPFEDHMKKFTKKIVGFTALVIVLTFAIGFKKFGFLEAGLLAVSLAVAAIPEDLPAVITIALSLGARVMAKKKALVRKLSVIESIGSVDVICTDKTGTITQGKMQVTEIWAPRESKNLDVLAKECCYFCNDSKKILDKNTKEKWVGDETDIALKEFSLSVNRKGKRLEERSFTSERKMMSVLYSINNRKIVYSKGAPEVILEKTTKYLCQGAAVTLTQEVKKVILDQNKKFASKGYRVLALAYKPYKGKIEEGLIFIGLVVLMDPARQEVKKAIAECHDAGIRVIMITGDNPLTAKTIGGQVGIKTNKVLTGDRLDRLSDEELKDALEKGVNVFARTNPFHKFRILTVLQKMGKTVAMTGDGVNDSLALKKADIGISMGLNGTEVAKEASDIILLDDNFATIRNAIKEGRRIFNNIRKFVNYLLTCNVAEVAVVLIATLVLPFISLFPIQILWINLITDGLPALALAVDPPRPDIMKRKPRNKREGIINKKLASSILAIGAMKSLFLLTTFIITYYVFHLGIGKARTTLFTGFILYELVRIVMIRYNEKLGSIKYWFENKILLYSLVVSVLLQVLIIYTPLNTIFKVVPLGLFEWSILLVLTIAGFVFGTAIAKVIDHFIPEDY